MMFPTIDKPFVIKSSLSVPSLKNNKVLAVLPNGKPSLRSNAKVKRFMRNFSMIISEEYTKQGFTVPIEGEAIYVCKIILGSNTSFGRKDLDNMVTTILEPLQGIVILDDKQIMAGYSQKELVKDSKFEHFVLMVWQKSKSYEMYEQTFKMYKDMRSADLKAGFIGGLLFGGK